MSEDLPLPRVIEFASEEKEAVLAQYFRTNTNSIGKTLTFDNATKVFLPTNVFNKTQTTLGSAIFPSGNSVTLSKTGSYVHNIYIYAHSTVPDTGIVAIDLVDSVGVQYGSNIFATKNVNNTSTDNLILSTVIESSGGDNFRIRFGGGLAGTGASLSIQVLAVMWNIVEK